MFVLLGPTYTTSVNVTGFSMQPGKYKVAVTGGTFHALDCDTNGAISIGGKYALEQNVPNPFGNSTLINYEIAHRQHVLLKLYDGMGTIVRTLVDEVQDQGYHQFRLEAETLPSGMYFYELTSGTFDKALWMEIAK